MLCCFVCSPAHAAQCTVSSPTASDPCCTALSDDVTYVTYLTLVEDMIPTTPETYYSCFETNADDSVAGQNNQAQLVDPVTAVIAATTAGEETSRKGQATMSTRCPADRISQGNCRVLLARLITRWMETGEVRLWTPILRCTNKL